MPTPEEIDGALRRIRTLADRYVRALDRPARLLTDGALVGPVADRLGTGLTDRYRVVRNALAEAFDRVRALAGPQAAGVTEPSLGAPPRTAPRSGDAVRSGDPGLLDRLIAELDAAGPAWDDAGRELAGLLTGLGLDAAPGARVRTAGAWVGAQAGDLRRRRFALIALGDAPAFAAPSPTGGEPDDRAESPTAKAVDLYVRHYLPGLAHGTKELGLLALATNPVTALPYAMLDHREWLARTPVGMLQGLWAGREDPVGFAKAMVNWDLWLTDPVRAFGEAVPGIVLTVATFGTGAPANAATRLGQTATRFARTSPHHPRPPDPQAPDGHGSPAGLDPQDPRTPDAPDNPKVSDVPMGAAPDVVVPPAAVSPALAAAERAAQQVAERFGVVVDFRSHPVDPGNAAAFARALENLADDYPGVLKDIDAIKVVSLDGWRAAVPHAGENLQGATLLAPQGGFPRGIYLLQHKFGDKAVTDMRAQQSHESGWSSVPEGLTARATLVHEFGHLLGERIMADPVLRHQLARELREVGVHVDPDGFNPSIPHGQMKVRTELSGYGAHNGAEMLAEAFAEWRLSPDPRPIATAVGSFIDQHFKGR
ncbi:hypothetical protein LO762_22935 [Actinocorallia sp. API 0066]|uniref:hypothetical protein n=1 Tax=Actinocorallia sp. API 0066 TaxID=2896846 RepID=UPI001E5D20B6|nr:hypothetical protein [Actinocorallia sp. API 0066]MCD0452024.1 hypothetical protein [Actinocorallia sp. API 0066]